MSRDGGLSWQRFHLGKDPLAHLLAVEPGGRVLVGSRKHGGVLSVPLDAFVEGPPPDWRELLRTEHAAEQP